MCVCVPHLCRLNQPPNDAIFFRRKDFQEVVFRVLGVCETQRLGEEIRHAMSIPEDLSV